MSVFGEDILQVQPLARLVLSLLLCFVYPSLAFCQTDITTWQGSLQHTGLNASEPTLTPASVGSPGNFGLIFTQQTDGQTYGQPLYVSSATLGQFADGSRHNVVYVATQAGSLYAFDADADPNGSNPNGTNSSPLWHANLIPAGSQPITQADVASTDILGDLAVTTTPVIDTASSTIYIVSTVKNPAATPPYRQYLYALDLKTGVPKLGSPVVVNATFSGTPVTPSSSDKDPVPSPGSGLIPFSPLHEHLRAAMVLHNGVVYLTYASHSDEQPYYGEILGYNATTLQLVQTFITTPNDIGGEAGIWQSGAGPAIDAAGNMYVVTGNGAFDQSTSSFSTAADWGESVLKLPTTGTGAIQVPFSDTTSWFTPSNWAQLNSGDGVSLPGDRDLGGGGMLLLPDQTEGNHAHIMVGGGKAGVLYVLDRDSLGGINPNDSTAIQEILEPNGTSLFVTPAYFNGNIYYAPDGGHLEQRKVQYDPVTGNYVSPTAITSTVNAPFKGAGVFISANGNTNGIVWTVGNALTAYDATNVTNPIFNAVANIPGSGGQCTTAKFSLPIEANGKVYYTCFNAATNIGYLFVSGLFPVAVGTPVAPTNLAAAANSSSQITLTWTNNATNQTGFTINRSTSPTGPFSLAATSSKDNTNFTDIGLNPATTYFYQVLATNANGSSIASNVASTTTFPAFTEAGLVAYWNMDDGAQLPNVFDVTGNGHLGTSFGEAGPTGAGYVNGAWIFHGTTSVDHIDVPNSAALQFGINQSFTLSAWVNPAALPGKEQSVITKSADQGNQYGIWMNSANQWVGRGPAGDLVGPTAVVNTWTNVALVQDGAAGTRSLYINGVLQATGPAQAADGAGDLWMGEQNVTSNVEGYQGEIDEVRLYNVALAPSAVTNTLAPAILEAVSTQTHGSAGPFGITLFPETAPPIEPRIGAVADTYNIVLHFAAPVAGIQASLGVQAGSTQSVVGQVGSVTYDATNTVVTVVLTGVRNGQALNLHLAGITPASVAGSSVPGTADIAFDVLQGDVTGDHVVDQYDVDQVQANFTAQVTQSTFPYDLNADGAVNETDANLVSGLIGASLAVPTDANLAIFKPATASTFSGNMTASMAVDNNVNSRWDSVEGSSADPSWIQVDLGHAANIHSVSINWNAEAANYLLQVSNDQTNWTTIQTVTGNTAGSGIVTFSGLNATGEFVRMYGTARATQYGYSINEFQIVGVFATTNTGSGTAPSITSPATATGTVGTAFTYQIAASQNPTSFGVSGLPAGLAVNAAGLISGTPTTAGTSVVALTASNSTGTGSATLSLTINPTVSTPQPPVGLTATAGNSQASLNWVASTGATSYSVYRGTSAGGESATPIATGVTATTFVDTLLTNGVTYFYAVAAVNSAGTSALSSEASATPQQPAAGTAVYQINAGGPAVAPFAADQFFDTGATSGTNNTVATTGVANAAPMAVYQTDRFGGAFTYTLPGLTAGASYTVRLHFAETYWTAAGKRVFNVAINGASVLSNFDIFANAGGANIALVEPFTATANSSGQIVIAFTAGAADLPKVNGIEVVATGGAMPLPATPVGLTATSGNNQVALTWIPGNGLPGTYSVFRGTSPGSEASAPIATGLSATYFVDRAVTNLNTYYYTVKATNGGGTSGASNETSAVPGAPVNGTPIYQVNAGGGAVAPFAADEFSTGGGTAGTGNSISTSAVVSPAPQAVYQTERNGQTFSYVFPNLNPGTTYLVRLHFAEFYWTSPGKRVFNVSINGTPVLQNFDIVAIAGAPHTALVEQFAAVADANGNITVTYTAGTADQPKASAIEVYQ
jgi:hypothetical protein